MLGEVLADCPLPTYNAAMQHTLTAAQADLFCKLARYEQDGRLFHPIRALPAGPDEYVIYLRGNNGNFHFSRFSDIDALCVVGLMEYSLTRMGDSKQFHITKFGRQLYLQDEISADMQFERIDFLQQATSNFKTVLGSVMAGDALARAIVEIQFVQSQAQSPNPSHSRIQVSLKQIQGMINSRFTYVTLAEATAAATAFGDWCEDILLVLERNMQMA